MATYSEILTAVQDLPTVEQIRLLDALQENIAHQELPPLSQEWLAEIERRTAEIKADRMEVYPWRETLGRPWHTGMKNSC